MRVKPATLESVLICLSPAISSRNPLDNAGLFAALHALGLGDRSVEGEAILRLARDMTRPASARTIALRVAFALRDVGCCPHRTGDDTVISFTCPHGSLARRIPLFAKTNFHFGIVVAAARREERLHRLAATGGKFARTGCGQATPRLRCDPLALDKALGAVAGSLGWFASSRARSPPAAYPPSCGRNGGSVA